MHLNTLKVNRVVKRRKIERQARRDKNRPSQRPACDDRKNHFALLFVVCLVFPIARLALAYSKHALTLPDILFTFPPFSFPFFSKKKRKKRKQKEKEK